MRYLNLFFRGVLCDALRFAKGIMSSTFRIADAAASAARVSVGAARDKYAVDAVDEKRSFINHPLTQPRRKPARF